MLAEQAEILEQRVNMDYIAKHLAVVVSRLCSESNSHAYSSAHAASLIPIARLRGKNKIKGNA